MEIDRLEQGLLQGLSAAGAGGAVATLVSGARTWTLASGEAAPGRAMTPATPIHICSCSKTFTAAVFASLVQRGQASWDREVREVVPEFQLGDPRANQACTFRDLAAMRVGLSRAGIAEWGIRQELPKQSRLERARAMGFAAPFRDRFTYSNLCYIALSLAAERLAGRPYPELVQELICGPLGLRETFSGETGGPDPGPASPYLPIDGDARPVRDLTGANSEGSARIHLSGRDAGQWMRFLLAALAGSDSGPLSAMSVAAMATPQVRIHAPDRRMTLDGAPDCGYGMGFYVSSYREQRLLRHGGGGRGWRHAMVLAPGAQAGVMLMASAESPMIEGVAMDLLDGLLGGGQRGWAGEFLLAAQAAAAAEREAVEARFPASAADPVVPASGRFGNAATGEVRIDVRGGDVHFFPEDAPDLAAHLKPLGAGTYELEFEKPEMSRQPLDPSFRLRFGPGVTPSALEATYFGHLERLT